MVEMHDCDDVDAVRLDAIQETVGELWNEETPKPIESEAFGFALVELSC